MPSYTRGETRENLTFVEIIRVGSNTFYGWKAKDITDDVNVSAEDITALGHRTAERLPAASLYMLRAQSPKPGRATKVINRNPSVSQKGSVSTHYAVGSVRQMLDRGWTITKRPRNVSLSNNSRFVTAIADLSNGLSYCFAMNKADFDTYGKALGLKSNVNITTKEERDNLVQASSFPRPGKASYKLESGKDFSSFFSSDSEDTLRAAGYKILYTELIDE